MSLPTRLYTLLNRPFPHKKGDATSPASKASGRQKWRFTWLGKIDWYIIRRFITTYLFLIAIIVSIAILFDFNERIDKFIASPAKWYQILVTFYLNFIPYFANLFSPLFIFIAVIFFTSNMAGHSEIIAMKSAGMSFRRLLRPYMVGAALIAALSFVLGCYIIPYCNEKRVNFDNQYIAKRRTFSEDPVNIQMQVDTGVVAYIGRFSNSTKMGYEFSLDKFENKKLVSRLTAYSIQYDTLTDHPYSWTINDYRIRTLRGNREYITSGARLDSTILLQPSDFYYVKGQQETLTQPQLREFINRQKLRGASGVAIFQVEYHKRMAAPFAAFILTLIGVCLSSQKRKGGMGAALGLGLALAFAFILFQGVSASFATNAGCPPLLAVWIPNIVFALVAYILYRRTPQ
ncbi:MAG: LptF/LptG family permease [Bacteroidaceae bacterium]|nr:LptF/LptG family permease [Bacteroidaceae bacterium]